MKHGHGAAQRGKKQNIGSNSGASGKKFAFNVGVDQNQFHCAVSVITGIPNCLSSYFKHQEKGVHQLAHNEQNQDPSLLGLGCWFDLFGGGEH